MKYANDKHIPFVAIVGEEELNTSSITLKNMTTGAQENLQVEALVAKLS
jgi:histidyl-tRNA synthetase